MKGTWRNLKGEFNHFIIDEGAFVVETACKHLHEKTEFQAELPSQPRCISCVLNKRGTKKGE